MIDLAAIFKQYSVHRVYTVYRVHGACFNQDVRKFVSVMACIKFERTLSASAPSM